MFDALKKRAPEGSFNIYSDATREAAIHAFSSPLVHGAVVATEQLEVHVPVVTEECA